MTQMQCTLLGEEIENHIVESLKGAVPGLEGVWLFGSMARGDADQNSDIDLFFLFDGDPQESRRMRIGGRLALEWLTNETGRDLDLVSSSRAGFNREMNEPVSGAIPRAVMSEGRCLYERVA